MSQGFLLSYKDAGYATTDTLQIPAGSLEGSVAVEATAEGKAYNAPAFAVSSGNTGLSYLQSIYIAFFMLVRYSNTIVLIQFYSRSG